MITKKKSDNENTFYEKLLIIENQIYPNQITSFSYFISIVVNLPLYFLVSDSSGIFLPIFFLLSLILTFRSTKSYFHKDFLRKKNSNEIYHKLIEIELNILLKSNYIKENIEIIILNNILKKSDLIFNFQEIIDKINSGDSLTHILKMIVFYSEDFNEYFRLFLENLSGNKNTNLKYQDKSFHNYRISVKALDSKLSLFFFISLFYPILFFFLVSFVHISNLEIFFSLLGYYFLLNFNLSKFRHENDVLIAKNRNENMKFREFMKFWYVFMNNICIDNSENAYIKTIARVNPKLKIPKIYMTNAFQMIKNYFRDFPKNTLFILPFFLEIIEDNNYEDKIGYFLNISSIIESHLDELDEYFLTIDSKKIMITLFKIVSSIIMGVLVPFLSEYRIVLNYLNNLDVNNFYPIIMFISSLVFLIISIFSYNQLLDREIFRKLDLLVLILFLFCYFISNLFIM